MSGRVRVLSERVMIKGREALVKSVMERVVHTVRKQSGFVRGDVLRDVHSPQLYCVLTEWDSVKHLDLWLKGDEYATYSMELNALLGQPTSYQILYKQKEEIFLL